MRVLPSPLSFEGLEPFLKNVELPKPVFLSILLHKRESFELDEWLFANSSLFVFSRNGLKQNARSLLTPVSHTDFYALSHGSLHFGVYGS